MGALHNENADSSCYFKWIMLTKLLFSYGDKYPKTFIGRVYIIIWTLLGLAITGIVTGSLTSSLNAASVAAKPKYPEDKVKDFKILMVILKFESTIKIIFTVYCKHTNVKNIWNN